MLISTCKLYVFLAALLAIVVTPPAYGQDATSNQQIVGKSDPLFPGRYTIVFSPHARIDAYLLDTYTGRIWEKNRFTDLDGEPIIWVPMWRADNDKTLSLLGDLIGPKKVKKKKKK